MEKAMLTETISDSDAMLIAEVSARAQEAFNEFQIEHCESLVVQFGAGAVGHQNTAAPPIQYPTQVVGGGGTPAMYAMEQAMA